jgi:hypothetical protein
MNDEKKHNEVNGNGNFTDFTAGDKIYIQNPTVEISRIASPEVGGQNTFVKTILMLSANPMTTQRLPSDKEIREGEESILRAKFRERFDFHAKLAVGFREFSRALLEHNPQIVHFTGHGTKDGILVEGEMGLAVPIAPKALSELFSLFTEQVECVILNSCYSAPQAAAISKHIDYVVGMRKEIKDKASIEFAIGFYDALGAGRTIEDAFSFGRIGIVQKYPDLDEHQIPILKKREGIVNK